MAVAYAPPLKIQGIKTKAVPFIEDSTDWDGAGRWIEPFVGSAAVALNIAPRRALLGDSNPHLINFYRAIQAKTVTGSTVREFLVREGGELARSGEEHYYRVRERFNDRHDPHDFLFLNRACFNGLMRFNRSGRFNTPFCRKPERFRSAYITRICNQVQHSAKIMAGKSWQFVCADWADVLGKARSGDFVYCDPPYAGRCTDYFNSWSDDDAARLEAKLKALPCRFLYSMWSENRYRRNDRLHEAFADYQIKTFSHFYHLGASESLRNDMTEALVVG
ncbi:MAG: Dam family site-specific DNA-(adenine-N6)-methyltransferase [Betaproteobacteria bacterium]|nr:Dam family site-specific DNA-(adenine-N6)-methyltransferase [Betaproteobacteria bacterium]